MTKKESFIPQVKQGQTNFEITQIIKAARNDPDFENGNYLGQEFDCTIKSKIHPNKSGKIIINVPGFMGSIDGYNNKYETLANAMQNQNLGAVIRIRGHHFWGYLPDFQVRIALKLAIDNAIDICGKSNPDIYLMGFSAGAGSIAAIAHEYPQVKKILLVAPSFDMPIHLVQDGLEKFQGKVVILQGENDEIVSSKTGPMCFEMAKTKEKEIFMIPNCDHQFKGTENGQIMSKAPFYTFSQDPNTLNFPSPQGGLILY